MINKLKCSVVNIHRDKYDVYCGRAGKGHDGYFGNPFPLGPKQPRGATIQKFQEYFDNRIKTDPDFQKKVLELRGKVLGCFCKQPGKDVPCHADVIANYVNNYFNDHK